MPTSSFAGVEQFKLKSQRADRTYIIGLKRPETPLTDHSPATGRPILILLDSFITLGTAIDSTSLRSLMGELEPAVIVGVGYAQSAAQEVSLRTRDLTPSASAGQNVPELIDAMLGNERGGAENFRAFLIEELVPAISARVPEASSQRLILFGHSLAGLFVAHVLMTHPEAFEAFIMNSPSLWWNNFEVPKRLSDLRDRLAATGASPRVLVSVGSKEQDLPLAVVPGANQQQLQDYVRHCRMVDTARDFAVELRNAGLPDAQFVLFPDEDHGSVVPAAVGRAVTFALGRSRNTGARDGA